MIIYLCPFIYNPLFDTIFHVLSFLFFDFIFHHSSFRALFVRPSLLPSSLLSFFLPPSSISSFLPSSLTSFLTSFLPLPLPLRLPLAQSVPQRNFHVPHTSQFSFEGMGLDNTTCAVRKCRCHSHTTTRSIAWTYEYSNSIYSILFYFISFHLIWFDFVSISKGVLVWQDKARQVNNNMIWNIEWRQR